MILTDYYKFTKNSEKTKLRMDCVASTKSYPEFEEKRVVKGRKESSKCDAVFRDSLVCYYGKVPDNFSADARRKADMVITMGSKNLSSVFIPDVELSNIGYGDVRGTSDAIIFVFHNLNVVDGRVQTGGTIEMFIARGKSKECMAIYQLVCDGELEEEMERLRESAKMEGGVQMCLSFDSDKKVTDSVTTG